MRYRRSTVDGATWFFTVNLAERKNDLLVRHIDLLRDAVRKVKTDHPFVIVAMVILPDHLHAAWQLPEGDHDYSLRRNLIKGLFSKSLPKTEWIRASRQRKRERGIWQRRFWEHQIRDESDLQRHVDYVHINPAKHGYVDKAIDWPHSSLRRYCKTWLATGKLGRWG